MQLDKMLIMRKHKKVVSHCFDEHNDGYFTCCSFEADSKGLNHTSLPDNKSL